jgi:hypothetical protein
MTHSKPAFADGTAELMLDHKERQLALEYLAEAWNSAEEDGIESQALAHASLFAALATLVRAHGEDATADLVEGLPSRIRAGEYNLERSLQ